MWALLVLFLPAVITAWLPANFEAPLRLRDAFAPPAASAPSIALAESRAEEGAPLSAVPGGSAATSDAAVPGGSGAAAAGFADHGALTPAALQSRDFYHLDALGSTVNLTDDAGAVMEAYLYDAWGNFRETDDGAAAAAGRNTADGSDKAAGLKTDNDRESAANPAAACEDDPDLDPDGLYAWETYLGNVQSFFATDPNRLTYTGHEFDPETGLYYAQARFYDPELGRFASEDPFIGLTAVPPSLHRYTYTHDNPLKYIDPTGNKIEPDVKKKFVDTTTLLKPVAVTGDYEIRGEMKSGNIVGYSAYNRKEGKILYTLDNQQDIENFQKNAKIYHMPLLVDTIVNYKDALEIISEQPISLKQKFLNQLTPYQAEVARMLEHIEQGDINEAINDLGRSWKEAAQDPNWWVSVVFSTTMSYCGWYIQAAPPVVPSPRPPIGRTPVKISTAIPDEPITINSPEQIVPERVATNSGPAPGSLSKVEARQWHLDQEARIPELIDKTGTLEQQAKQAFELRNQFRTQTRDLMADRAVAERLMRDEPNLTWDQVVARAEAKGMKGDDVYRYIIESSQRSRTSVNQQLGVKSHGN